MGNLRQISSLGREFRRGENVDNVFWVTEFNNRGSLCREGIGDVVEEFLIVEFTQIFEVSVSKWTMIVYIAFGLCFAIEGKKIGVKQNWRKEFKVEIDRIEYLDR